MSELERLAAIQDIRQLVALYCRAVDRQDFDALRSLYLPDAIDDHAGRFRGNVEAYVAWLHQVSGPVEMMSHHVGNHVIAVDGNEGEGEVSVLAFHRIRDPDGERSDVVEGLRYLDKYHRRGGRWRFAARTAVIDWCRTAPAPSPEDAAPSGHDPSYLILKHGIFARSAEP